MQPGKWLSEELVMGGIDFILFFLLVRLNEPSLYLETYICELTALYRSCFLKAFLCEGIPKSLCSGWQSNKVHGLLGSFSFSSL